MKVIKATITKRVKGGYLLTTDTDKRAFLPNSLSQRSQSPYRIHHPLNIGDNIYATVIKDSPQMIVSRKHYMQKVPFDMPYGEPTKGIIASVMPYGIFIDVGQSADGFIHDNNLPQPADTYKKGTEVTVKLTECNEKGPVFELVNA